MYGVNIASSPAMNASRIRMIMVLVVGPDAGTVADAARSTTACLCCCVATLIVEVVLATEAVTTFVIATVRCGNTDALLLCGASNSSEAIRRYRNVRAKG